MNWMNLLSLTATTATIASQAARLATAGTRIQNAPLENSPLGNPPLENSPFQNAPFGPPTKSNQSNGSAPIAIRSESPTRAPVTLRAPFTLSTPSPPTPPEHRAGHRAKTLPWLTPQPGASSKRGVTPFFVATKCLNSLANCQNVSEKLTPAPSATSPVARPSLLIVCLDAASSGDLGQPGFQNRYVAEPLDLINSPDLTNSPELTSTRDFTSLLDRAKAHIAANDILTTRLRLSGRACEVRAALERWAA